METVAESVLEAAAEPTAAEPSAAEPAAVPAGKSGPVVSRTKSGPIVGRTVSGCAFAETKKPRRDRRGFVFPEDAYQR